MTAVARRLLQPFTKFGGFNVATIDPSVSSFSRITASGTSRFDCRQISQLVKCNGNRPFLVDTLALVMRLEAQGIPTEQAQAITATMTNMLNDSLENMNQLFVPKEKLQEMKATKEFNYSKIKSELQIAQGHHISSLKHESEKLMGEIEKIRIELQFVIEKLQGDIEMSCSEQRSAFDRVIDSLRLGLNVEKDNIQDQLANQSAKIFDLNRKIDQEIHGLGARLEAAKTEVIKCCFIASFVSAIGVGYIYSFLV